MNAKSAFRRALVCLLGADRRTEPVGANPKLGVDLLRQVLVVAALLAFALALAGLLNPAATSPTSLLFSVIMLATFAPWLFFFSTIPLWLHRALVLVVTASIQLRWAGGFLLGPSQDAVAVLVYGLSAIPVLLILITLLEGRQRTLRVGLVCAALMAVTFWLGAPRFEAVLPGLDPLRSSGVILTAVVLFTYFQVRFAEQQTTLADAQMQVVLLEKRANTDPLTGLLNRRGIDVIVTNWLSRREPFGVMLLDLDRFKKVNDDYGHEVGDRVLQRVAAALREAARDCDVLARWGGEELLIMSRHAEERALIGFADRLRRIIREIDDPGMPRVSASIGISRHVPGEYFDHAVNRADAALYAAKEAGRDCSHAVWPHPTAQLTAAG